MRICNIFAAGALLASTSVALAQSEQATFDINQMLRGRPSNINSFTVTSSTAEAVDNTVYSLSTVLRRVTTCSGNNLGVQRTTVVFASAEDVEAGKSIEALQSAAKAYASISDDIFFKPAPEDEKPEGMGKAEWQQRYYLSRLADQFQADNDITLTFMVAEVPDPNMTCNLSVQPTPN